MSAKGCLIAGAVAGLLAVAGTAAFLAVASPETLASVPGTQASDLSQRCRAREASACTAFASMLDRAHSPAARTREYMVEGCSLGDASACDLLMTRCSGGDWLADQAVLQALVGRCEKSGDRSCKFVVQEARRTAGLETLVRRAARGGCEHDDYELCERFGMMARKAEGGPADPPAARETLEKACRKAKLPEACDRAGWMQYAGEGGPKDMLAAASSSAVACEAVPDHCWNAGEFAELVAWSQCAGLLKQALLTDVKVSDQPVLEQNSHAVVTSYTTPDRYESVLKERGIFFPRTYVETTRIPGRTYTDVRTQVDRYAAATMLIDNKSCARVQVDVEMTFDFDGWDSLKRGALAGALTYFLAKASGASDSDSEAAALGIGVAAGASGLTAKKTVRLAPNEEHVLGLEVDTQSLFGNNRKMKSVKIARFDLSFPDGSRCTPQCLIDLRELSGQAAPIRAQYQRACDQGRHKEVCYYLQAVRAGNNEALLSKSCNSSKPPNCEGACSRLTYASWLTGDKQ